jgi:putative spermidine/putrescine transport system permease protein
MLKKLKPYFLISPLLILYLIFIGGGLMETVKESMGYIPMLELNNFNFNSYREVFSQKDFIENTLYSLYISFTGAISSTFFGILTAYFFVKSENFVIKSILKRALQTGMILPYIYVIFLAAMLFNQTGFFSRLFYHAGIIKDFQNFPVLVFDSAGIGIIWVYVFKGTPFVTLFVINVMSGISNSYDKVARTLGAGELTVLRRIYIPLSSNAIIWSSSIVFAYFLGSFEVPYILGSISPSALSSRLYSLSISPELEAIPQAMALSLVIFLTGLIFVGLYGLFLKFLLKGKFS